MPTPKISAALLQEAVNQINKHGEVTRAAAAMGLPRSTLDARLREAKARGILPQGFGADDPGVLKSKIKKLESELRKAQVGATELQIVRQAIGAAIEGARATVPPQWTIQAPKANSSPGVPTLFLSDFHWGERVNPSEIEGANEFNLAIARRRLAHTVQTAVHLLGIVDPKMRYPGIVLPLGGDMITGNIHDELVATNELQTMPTVLDLYGYLIATITALLGVFENVFVPCVGGNHGRDTRKTWSKLRNHTSFDWLLYQFLAKHFEGNKRVRFHIPDGSDAHYRIFSTRYLLTHGDQFRGGDSIIGPIGPLTRGNQKKQARNQAISREYDVMLAGHWHQYIHLERLIVNGALKGYDEYAYQGNFGFEPPRQALWITHPRYGITFRMPVLCEPPAAATRADWVSIKGAKR